jgi:tRNA-2-methylthio-N6-dimethylallyladenosine synthase
LEGSVEGVLVEGRSKQSDRDVTGRTRSNKIVNFEGSLDLIGKLIPIKILKAYPHSLRGEIRSFEFGLSLKSPTTERRYHDPI